jgi:hypothetical protein
MNNRFKQGVLTPVLAVSLFAGGAAGMAALASAQTPATTSAASQSHDHSMHMMGPGVMGTVSAISGNTITVTGKDNTSYMVDATNAKILKGAEGAAPATGSISDIKVGDTVGVRGTVTGTSVAATEITDGVFMHGVPGGYGKGPGVAGTVSAINGNTITITGKDGVSYTIDAASAAVTKVSTVAVSDIQVGDSIGVDGTVSGTTVTAKHIMDGMPVRPDKATGATQTQ